jgi:hypothetical protein
MPKRLTILLLFVTPCFSAADTSFTLVGARGTGLGGAFTAVADDATAFYWNPAGVARGSFVRVGFFGGYSFQDREELISRLGGEMAGEGSELDGDRVWGLATSFTVLGVSVSRFTYTSSLLDGDTLHSRGLRTWDAVASFVQSLPPDDLIVGVNLRYIRGTAYSDTMAAAEIPAEERNVKGLVDGAVALSGRTESEPGIDFGVLYQPADWIRLGVTGRNLNRPTFHTDALEEIHLERHARAGVAFFLAREILVAVDVDVSRRPSHVGVGGWRELSAGIEKTLRQGTIAIRGGLRTEAGEDGLSRPGFSGGIGFQIAGVSLDLTAVTSTRDRMGALWLGVSYNY